MIRIRNLTKRYGDTTAVRDLSVDVLPGTVTGFLGPNGAGKSTTMRIVVGVDHPTTGSALVDGVPYPQLRRPLRVVGALLEARSAHPGRSGRAHLRAMARSNGIPDARVDQVLELVGLTQVAGRRVGGYSLGMTQRLGIAGALLGDPPVLMLDEPVNGLDPDGVRWVRCLTRTLADEGRTVLVSSHLMSEMQLMADHLLVMGQGALLADAPLQEVLRGTGGGTTHVRCGAAGDAETLARQLTVHGLQVSHPEPTALQITGASPEHVGDVAFEAGVRLHALYREDTPLEDAYLRLTGDRLEFAAGSGEGSAT